MVLFLLLYSFCVIIKVNDLWYKQESIYLKIGGYKKHMRKKNNFLSTVFSVIFFLVAVAFINKIEAPSETNPKKLVAASNETSSKSDYHKKSSDNSTVTPNKDQKAASTDDNPPIEEKFTIVLDPGHGDYDPGSVGPNGTLEKDINLAVALKLGKVLESNGLKVIYTRKDDKVFSTNINTDLIARADVANDNSADIFISIHLNSSDYADARGTETYYHPVSTNGKILAEKVQTEIVKTVKLPDRGVKSDDFLVLRKSLAPAILVELGYISNSEDESILNDSAYQEKFANAIANGILTYLKVQ